MTNLIAEVKTWDSNVTDLFDFKSVHQTIVLYFKESNFLGFRKNSISKITNQHSKDPQIKILAQIKYQPKHKSTLVLPDFFLCKTSFSIYRVLKDEQIKYQRAFKLKKGNQIKLGKHKYKVIYVRVINKLKSNQQQQFQDSNIRLELSRTIHQSFHYKVLENDQTLERNVFQHKKLQMTQSTQKLLSESEIQEIGLCRICQQIQNVPQNPKVYNLCKCQGTTNGIHYYCLKKWIQTNIRYNKIGSNVHQIDHKSIRCQICLQYYPCNFINIYGQKMGLYPYQNFDSENVILLYNQKQQDTILIDFSSKAQITIGRSKKNDWQIKQLTVSREHAEIKLIKNNYYIFDKDSKFGTLINIQRDQKETVTQIKQGDQFQIGTTNIRFRTQTISRFLFCK